MRDPVTGAWLPEGVVPVNASLLVSDGPPFFARHGYYVDIPVTCSTCSKPEVWTAQQQKWWYEIAGGHPYSHADRCRACRRAKRARDERSRNWQRVGDVAIKPLQLNQARAAARLVAAGLAARFGSYDAARNPDLGEFAARYVAPAENVAFTAGAFRSRTIVGCGVLLRRTEARAEIVRMSVASTEQRRGLGRALVGYLIDNARRLGYREIVLETSSAWQDAIAFYRALGFEVTHSDGMDTWFRMTLEPDPESALPRR